MVTSKNQSARDRSATEARILEALGEVLAENGFTGVGVNAVARAAGVDKVLIYRYFGGLQELLRAYSQQSRFWPTIRELIGQGLHEIAGWSAGKLAGKILAGHLHALRNRPQTQEIMRWELHQSNALTAELARAREQQGTELLGLMPIDARAPQRLDLAAMAAIVHAGITYLVLRSKTADVYLGIDLRTEAGWKRIEAAAQRIAEVILGERGAQHVTDK